MMKSGVGIKMEEETYFKLTLYLCSYLTLGICIFLKAQLSWLVIWPIIWIMNEILIWSITSLYRDIKKIGASK